MSRILIVEDEEAIAELEKDYLELSGFDVVIEKDGDLALERGVAEKFDMYILDIMLPGVDGFELCRRFRDKSNAPILLVSARKEDIDKIRGLGMGADDYITKPFSPSELVARVKAHLARYDRLIGALPPTDDIINIQNLRIDRETHRVWLSGEERTLTSKEFDLLLFLVEHPNQVFSKEELFREIWDEDIIGDIATVPVHIKKVREKIEVNPANPQFIETVWGVGYRFRV
ncbi:MAG: response regulator transcription factor [Lachnospiraceae bacterium]|nr:response regulator transcription factor [Lachnospiraceae bacterium]